MGASERPTTARHIAKTAAGEDRDTYHRSWDDIGGIATHIGARVAALAKPSEILVSRTVVNLVAGSGLQFADRGSHALKGVPGEWQLFAAAN